MEGYQKWGYSRDVLPVQWAKVGKHKADVCGSYGIGILSRDGCVRFDISCTGTRHRGYQHEVKMHGFWQLWL